MEVSDAVRTLRSTRRFSSQPIDPDLIERWIDIARWCGSSRNSQPWRFITVRNRATLGRLAMMGASAQHLAGCHVAVAIVSIGGPYPFSTVFDIGRVTQSLMLLAHADSVGSCIAVFEPAANVDAVGVLLGVPPGARVDLAVGFGSAAKSGDSFIEQPTSPSPLGRRSVSQLLFSERYGAVESTG